MYYFGYFLRSTFYKNPFAFKAAFVTHWRDKMQLTPFFYFNMSTTCSSYLMYYAFLFPR